MSLPDARIATRGPRSGSGTITRTALARGLAGAVATCLLVVGCATTPYRAVDLRITHRMYPRFKEERTVLPRERFQVGDTDYQARITEFVPDFVMDEKTGKVASRSDSLRNPAFRLEVFQADTLVERAWAFMKGGPPHFSRSSMLNFEIERIDWKPGRGPLGSTAAPDSLRTAP